jgi:CRISPR-associated protein Csx17
MNKQLHAIPFTGITPDTLGGYLCGLGLLSACAQIVPSVRGCWRDDIFHMLVEGPDGALHCMGELLPIDDFLVKKWKRPKYPGGRKASWSDAQKQDTDAKKKKKASSAVRLYRCDTEINDIRFIDSHIVSARHNIFNPIFGTGGNIGKRNLAKLAADASDLLGDEIKAREWLANALYGEPVDLPELPSSGTWFPFANKTFNSGQDGFFREGRLSPWSFLLALEGALLLRGEVGRRLSATARPYVAFPFISEPPSPISESNVGLKRPGVFWAPIWNMPANFMEVRSLLKRGLARIGKRTATAPHEFAVAAMGLGFDAGLVEFAPFELRETTSSQVFEAMPMPHVYVRTDERSHRAAELISSLVSWMARLPYEPTSGKKKGKFSGLRGPIEQAIISVSEEPEDASRWQELLLMLAQVQKQVDWDSTRGWRQRAALFPRLSQAWLDFAWPDGRPLEIEIAAAVASVGGGTHYPLACNIYGVRSGKEGFWFPKDRPLSAVWHESNLVDALGDILHRRLVDHGSHIRGERAPWPLIARHAVGRDMLDRFLNDGVDDAEITRWLPALSLLDWRRSISDRDDHEPSWSGLFALDGVFRPLLTAGLPWKGNSRKQTAEPDTAAALRLAELLRQGDLDGALDFSVARYRALGAQPIQLTGLTSTSTTAQRLLAALLIPISRRAILTGRARWNLNTTD